VLYNELYFSSINELNDPYDTRIGFIFKGYVTKYQKLFEFCFKKYFTNIDYYNTAKYLAKHDRTYEELILEIRSGRFHKLLYEDIKIMNDISMDRVINTLIPILIIYIKSCVEKYSYICSFSTKYDNPLVWSHYADQHRGMAFIFRPFNNKLYQDPMSRDIKYTKTDGTIKYRGIPINYEVENVIYQKKVDMIDGFVCFNEYIYGQKISSDVRNDYINKWLSSAKKKYYEWSYEYEKRIIDYDDGFASKTDENGKTIKSSIERIFHYDPTQLVGIIFGSMMKQENIAIMKQLIYKKRGDVFTKSGLLPFFYFIEAKINERKYELDMEVLDLIDGENHKIDTTKYDEIYENQEKLLKIMRENISDEQKLYHVYSI
jgi:Protein of unknown function (DUF2971).